MNQVQIRPQQQNKAIFKSQTRNRSNLEKRNISQIWFLGVNHGQKIFPGSNHKFAERNSWNTADGRGPNV